MAESQQKWLGRNRPPRVQITYDVETNGAELKKELPFIVGVMADLSGQPEKALPQVRDRRFVEISRDNFNNVLEKVEPRLVFGVEDKISKSGDEKLRVELKFKSMEDFKPEKVAQHVPSLNELLQARTRLSSLLSKMYVNDRLVNVLDDIVSNTQAQERISKEKSAPKEASEKTEKET